MNRQLLDGVARVDETAAKKASDRGTPVSEAVIRDELVWASPGIAAVGVVCWHASLPQIHPYAAGAAGLVTHLPTLWWLGLVLVVAAVIVELLRDSPRLGAMVVCIAAVALVLHGTLPASEVTPRFDSAYDIAGFADYIGRFGRTLPYDDARMSWPAMMSATGMLARAMHVPTLWFVRWAPLVLNLAYLVPIKAIANVSLRTPRARWAALPIFLASNWIDQDYFSPQAIGLLLFLVIVAIAMRTFATRGEQPKVVRSLMNTKLYRAAIPPVLRLASAPLPCFAGRVGGRRHHHRATGCLLRPRAVPPGGGCRVPPVHPPGLDRHPPGAVGGGPHQAEVAVVVRGRPRVRLAVMGGEDLLGRAPP